MNYPNQDLTPDKQRLLAETRADLLKRQLSNAENYDKAILSLSTVFLGFSFAFLKDFVPAHLAEGLYLVYVSWIMLTAAVVTTVISFWVSQWAIDEQLKKAEDYYLRGNEGALEKSETAKITDYINFASGALFIFGVSLTTVFVFTNFERGLNMSNNNKGQQAEVRQAAPIPKMQETSFEKGAPIPNLQPVLQGQPPQGQPPAQSTPAAPPSSTTPSGDSKK
jgi:hypothetical protein